MYFLIILICDSCMVLVNSVKVAPYTMVMATHAVFHKDTVGGPQDLTDILT